MPHRRRARLLGLAPLLLAAFAGCAQHTHCTDFNGVPGLRGEPVEYQLTSCYALHALWFVPILGDASLENAVHEFTAEASARGARRVHIVNTVTTHYWYVLPPVSFFIHPVVTEVGGDVEGTVIGPSR
jgi:hypothetical protein